MEPLVIGLVLVVAALAGVNVWLVLRARKPAPVVAQPDQAALIAQLVQTTQQELARQREVTTTELARTRTELQRSLGENQQSVNQRLDNAARLFTDISKGLGQVNEFSSQLANLRDVFQSPKLRGNVGEEILRTLLEQVLPRANYAMQFKFREGQVVDAIVKTKQGLIPIDSKFPMENFRVLSASSPEEEPALRKVFERDVKKHIDAIASKYVLPGEGTVDFAVMYVPSEAVYYEVVQRSEALLDYAAERRVYLVSPNTFYYFLKVVLIGLEGARMEEVSKQVLQLLRTVQKDAHDVGEAFDVLSRHVTNAKNTSDKVAGKFERLTGKLDQADLLEAPAVQAKLELEVPIVEDAER